MNSEDNGSKGLNSESIGTGEENNKSYDMTLIEESIAEAERDIAEGTKLLAGNADKGTTEDSKEGGRKDTREESLIFPEMQVPTTENV